MFTLFFDRKIFAWFILFLMVGIGVWAMLTIPKESTPEVKIPVVQVNVSYSGASSTDVETLVTEPLEDGLSTGLNNVDEITSRSQEGRSTITVNFDTTVDVDEALPEVREEVRKVESDLPTDASEPQVNEFSFEDQPVFVVSLSSSLAFTQLNNTAERVEEELSEIAGVSRVETSGIPEEQITIILNKTALDQYDLDASKVHKRVQQSNFSLPAGSFIQNNVEYNLSVNNEIDTVSSLRNVIVGSHKGQYIYVKDIATIADGLAKRESLSRLSSESNTPQQAVTFSVFKQLDADITSVTQKARTTIESIRNDTVNAELVTLIDRGKDIQKDIQSLSKSALITIILVITVLSIGLGVRESLIASTVVPLSFLFTFIGLYYMDFTINFISLFALILSIGLLVDASIVIIEGITMQREKGANTRKAIANTLHEYASPVIAGTMTTLVVFIPLATLTGITGEFIRSIPVTVILVLLSALIVALFFIPLFSTAIFFGGTRKQISKAVHSARQRVIHGLTIWYSNVLRYIFKKKKRSVTFFVMILLVFFGSVSLVPTGLISSEFFPSDNFDRLTITAELPKGSLLEDVDKAVQPVESYLQNQNFVDSFVSRIRVDDADITVILTNEDVGDRALTSIRNFIAQYDKEAELHVDPPSGGPEGGAPIEIQITGERYEQVVATSNEFKEIIRTLPSTVDVESNISENKTSIVLKPDMEKIQNAGLQPIAIAELIRTSVFGSEATTIRRDGEDVSVVVQTAINNNYTSASTTNHITLDQLLSLPVTTPEGDVPLGVFVEAELQGTTPVIYREEGQRVVTVSSHIERDVVLSDVQRTIQSKLKSYEAPDDISWQFGGDVEANEEAREKLMRAVLIGIALVIGVLMFQFNSIKKTLFVMSVIPLGLTGVLLGLFILDEPLSFTALLGFVALVGIVVNNSIILIDVLTNLQKENNITHEDLVIKGASKRIRPILLTTITTIMGMVPLLFTSPTWKPLALSIISGLIYAVILTLFIVPLMYYWWGKSS